MVLTIHFGSHVPKSFCALPGRGPGVAQLLGRLAHDSAATLSRRDDWWCIHIRTQVHGWRGAWSAGPGRCGNRRAPSPGESVIRDTRVRPPCRLDPAGLPPPTHPWISGLATGTRPDRNLIAAGRLLQSLPRTRVDPEDPFEPQSQGPAASDEDNEFFIMTSQIYQRQSQLPAATPVSEPPST